MKLSEQRVKFTQDCAKLRLFAATLPGYGIAIDDAKRSKSYQKEQSNIKDSQHLLGLAEDYILYYKGVYEPAVTPKGKERYRILGEYWESLDILNRWGGRFGTPKSKYDTEIGYDACHFERMNK